ncbi:TPA: nitroreductase family protein [Candidatus Galligastranaerophilus intestinavium]|uniref:Nitroreductase family protein n=1 Tax=Candidatus Galligastranaerophilus intestinavium TaxID=2840836 RepID=A0A9D1JWT9_9BACT|nr:nitroreductase family protein [Candidatus Galligastranaerophilus intestinavium]
MKNIVVDKSKCTHCGLCISDCVSGCISFDGENFPKTDDEKRCISCQHCLAICPTGALSFGDKHPNNSQNVEYSDILGLIKSRKSVRQYKDEEIPQELLDKLKQMLPYVPTGCNNHSLHFSIVETKSAMDEIRKKVNDLLIKTMSYKALSPIMNKFSRYKDAFLKGEDVIFRGAPHMIVVSSPISAPCANIDPIIALSYFELYAQHLGIGTCWCGFAQACLMFFPQVCEMLEIPSGYKPVYAMLFGMPKVKYQRTTQPEPYTVSQIKEIRKTDSCVFCRIKRFFTNFLR